MATATISLSVLPGGTIGSVATLHGLKNYEFHSNGNVWNKKYRRFVKGCLNSKGYRMVKLTGDDGTTKSYRLSRLIATAFFGPSELLVDHKDRNRANDRLDNLRLVSPQQNAFNRSPINTGSSTHLGVTKVRERFRAEIKVNGQRTRLGYFASEELAAAAYQTAKQRLHSIPEVTIGLSPEDVANALALLSNRQTCSTRSAPQKVRS